MQKIILKSTIPKLALRKPMIPVTRATLLRVNNKKSMNREN